MIDRPDTGLAAPSQGVYGIDGARLNSPASGASRWLYERHGLATHAVTAAPPLSAPTTWPGRSDQRARRGRHQSSLDRRTRDLQDDNDDTARGRSGHRRQGQRGKPSPKGVERDRGDAASLVAVWSSVVVRRTRLGGGTSTRLTRDSGASARSCMSGWPRPALPGAGSMSGNYAAAGTPLRVRAAGSPRPRPAILLDAHGRRRGTEGGSSADEVDKVRAELANYHRFGGGQ